MAETSKDHGEREAILLALEVHAAALLVDDKDARRSAAAVGLRTIGTLGTLRRAADRGLLELAPAIEQVRRAGLYVSQQMIDDVIRDAAQRGAADPDSNPV